MSVFRNLLMGRGSGKDYIKFADPAVEKICAENWGDGIGITYAQAAKITTLGNKFKGNTEITSFNEFQYFGCTYINTSEFEGCTALNEITLPDIITKISYKSFKDTALLNIDCKNATEFGSAVFQNCQNLIHAKIAIDLNRNGPPYSLFYDCHNLQTVELGKVTRIPQEFFYNTKALELPDGFFDEVLSVGSNAFCGSGIKLDNLYLPKCTTLNGSSFRNCTNITGELNLPSLETINGTTALNNLSITAITSLGNITTDGTNGNISNYPYLKTAVMPDSLLKTGWVFLCDCPLLETVEFGPNLNTIDGNLLSRCKSLKSVIFNSATPPIVNYPNYFMATPTPSNVNIYVPDESVDLYKAADVWNTKADYIKPLSKYVPE